MIKENEEIKEFPPVRVKEENAMNVSRRTLLQGAVTLGVAAASGLAMNLAMPGSAEAMSRIVPKKWDEKIDVVIVGSGFAGLSAAAEARNFHCQLAGGFDLV